MSEVPTGESDTRQAPFAMTHIVGIGASAGGLEALEQFFEHVPETSGLAYLVVQHLDPTHKALLASLLQRVTSMPVNEAADTMPIKPNHVYVIPPNAELSVAGGRLKIRAPSTPRGMRLPINVLFSSLARDQHEAAIGVVLSGMGVDGTQGLQSIKSLGGLCAVQSPHTAQFDSMPKNAIAAGCDDIVASPAELPGRILATIKSQYETMTSVPMTPGEPRAMPPEDSMEHIIDLLRLATRHDFSLYKMSTVHRRIDRRMAIHALSSLDEYAQFLEHNPNEIELLFKELLIGVTQFYRDAPVWQYFEDRTLPDLLKRRAADPKLRAWLVGCSTGEEAYSLAISFAETIRRLPQYAHHALQIFATDLSSDAIATARRGEYPLAIERDVPAARLAHYFTKQDGYYRLVPGIRDTVLFAEQDVVLDPPFTRLDILCCRNLLIYFDNALQQKLLPLFHYSLRAGGVLMLGSSETIGRFSRLFSTLDSKLRLYQHVSASSNVDPTFPSTTFPPLMNMKKEPPALPRIVSHSSPDNLQAAADRVLLQVYAPPAVVVNGDGDIIYISGRTGEYLEPASGKANWNFHAMIRDDLRAPLTAALAQARLQDSPVYCTGLASKVNDSLRTVNVTVQQLHEPASLRDKCIVVFRDMPTPGKPRRRQGALDAAHAVEADSSHDEIQRLREEARSTREELQSANEQLQSTNEELQSTNEELQSTNEELMTSKEEMQSMNEELQTVNTEMQTRLDDLALAQGDLANLLNSTNIAILFLDHDLNVRRYTDRAAKIINLREIDIGRPLSDLTTSLQYPSLHDDAQNTMRTLVFSEKQIQTTDERWFSVRIMPYRRLDDVIDGAVITFVDITATKELEADLRRPE